MSSTDLMDITVLPIFAPEIYDTLRIIFDDDESGTWGLVLDEIFGQCSIPSTELDDSIGS